MRLRVRVVLGTLIYEVIERTVGTNRHLEPSPVQRSGAVDVKPLQLVRLERKRGRAVADRCGQPLLRLWLLGVDVNVSDGGRLIELGSGQLLALDVVGTGSETVMRAVPAGADGPRGVLW